MRITMGLIASLAACSVAGLPPASASSPGFAIIVADDVSTHALSRESAAFIFERKQLYWQRGARIQPINLPAAHALRRLFSLCVLGQEPEAMENYWREMYFHGVVPPFVLESEQAVVLFVSTTPGAIGYVSSCPPGLNVRVVLTIGDAPNCPKPTATCASPQD
jgi:ABC-type phosphate transport system substrate-binding protein